MLASRSSVGIGITPPNVLPAPKPVSSVMISTTLGAPLGGTTRAGQWGFDCKALGLISPPNGAGGLGRYLPSMVVVASGEPGAPVVCCAWPVAMPSAKNNAKPRAPRSAGGIKYFKSFIMLPLLPIYPQQF